MRKLVCAASWMRPSTTGRSPRHVRSSSVGFAREKGRLAQSEQVLADVADHRALEQITREGVALQRAWTALARGDVDAAEQHVAAAKDSARVAIGAEALLVAAAVARARGDSAAQCEHANAALGRLPTGAPVRLLAEARLEVARCLAGRGDVAGGRRLAEQVIAAGIASGPAQVDRVRRWEAELD